MKKKTQTAMIPLVATLLALAAPANAQEDKENKPQRPFTASLEVMAGVEIVANDFNFTGNIVPHDMLSVDLAVRDLQDVRYDGSVDNLLLGRIEMFNLKGLRLHVEGQNIYCGAQYNYARAGLVYSNAFGPFWFVAQTGIDWKAQWENVVIAALDFERWSAGTEWIFTGHGIEYAKLDLVTSHTRVSYKPADWLEVGAGLNTIHIREGQNYQHGFNPGVSLKMKWRR